MKLEADEMRFGELRDREIINIETGEKLGTFGNCELDIDISTGQIISIIVIEGAGSFFSFLGKQEEFKTVIPWENIKKIGKDTIMVSI